MSATVGVVGCTTRTGHGRDQFERLAAAAGRRGVRLVGLDLADALTSGADRVAADHYVTLTGLSQDDLALADTAGVDAFLTTREAFVPVVARLAALTGTPGNPVDVVETMRHKDRCREALRAAGFPQPAIVLLDGSGAAHADARRLGPPPWVLKPTVGMGSEGVTLVADADEIRVGADAAGGPVLVESFVDGREVSVEGVLLGGEPRLLTVTAKTTSGFVESAHRAPSDLDPAVRQRVEAAVAGAVRTLRLTHGILHVEAWLVADGTVVLGEVHARPGGDFIHALVEETRPGTDLFGLLLDDLLGREPAPVTPETRHAGVRYLQLPEGVVDEVHVSPSQDPRILRAVVELEPGTRVGPLRSSSDRPGVFLAVADRADEVTDALELAVAGVHVTWRDR